MQATLHKDKIFLDVTDSVELAELFGRKEPGDKVRFKGEATMDDKANGTITLSIDDITIEAGKKSKARDDDNDEVDDDKVNDEEPTSVTAMKSQVMENDLPVGPADTDREGAI